MSGDALEELIRRLPTLLKERPELAEKLYAALGDRFVTNEALKKYMEQSDRRFENLLRTTTQRFEASDKRFEELRADTNKRFEASDKRFEELLTRMDRSFAAAEKHREALKREHLELERGHLELEREHMKLKAAIGSLERRSGIALERTILSLFRQALKHRGIDVEKVEKIGIRDEHGELFRAGAKVEYDLYIHNGGHILFEIKYHVTEQEIDVFIAKAKFFEQQKGISPKKVVLTLEIDEHVKRICEDHEIEVITAEI